MAVQPTADDLRLLKEKVFLAARDNHPQVIQDCLASLHPDVVKDVLHHCSTYQGTRTTPLITAAWNGHLEVVELLVNEFNVDVNQKFFDTFSVQCALFSAVCHGHLDILKYLVDNGAEMDNSVQERFTCLEIACLHNNLEMLEYLLSKGADPNQRNEAGRTALHQAAELGAADLIRLLLHHGARLFKDKRGRSPLMEAALKPSSEPLNVFLESAVISLDEKIEVWELRGAKLAETNVDEAFIYLRNAMKERLKNPNNLLAKSHSLLPTLSIVWESQTLEELQARRSDQHLFRLECLAIMSRILEPNDSTTVFSYNAYSEELQSSGRDGEATAVFLHGMKAALTCNFQPHMTTQVMHLLSFKFVELLQNGMLTFFPDLREIMESILDMLEKHEPLNFGDHDFCDLLLSFILLALKVAQGQEEGRCLQRLVERCLNLVSGLPVLCAVVQFYWNRPVCLRDVEDLPYDLLVTFVVQCGADIHVKDCQRNTPLHAVARLSKDAPDSDLVSIITKTLLDAGAFVGVKNTDGQTPLDLAGPRLAAELRELYPASLKSLAATTVVSCNNDYATEVPEDLAEFILKH